MKRTSILGGCLGALAALCLSVSPGVAQVAESGVANGAVSDRSAPAPSTALEVTPPTASTNRPVVRRSGDPPAKRKVRVEAARRALHELHRRITLDHAPPGAVKPPATRPGSTDGDPTGHVFISNGPPPLPLRNPQAIDGPRTASTRTSASLRETAVVRTGATMVQPSSPIPPPTRFTTQADRNRTVAGASMPRTGMQPAPATPTYPSPSMTTGTNR